ncbi:hypothetical protein CC85DRAFT_286292 [Cutaneotrichosporon oleaginosum]|uniref:Uncharacterized protein n=1 Tax=Cutaneotrichosporon oleaginosum TaxID=879819 RepID=A0A0J1B1Z2_9TREE|nr:uncharacterized protein CC85DRAFT_286292 [Cutaneotrichosporon oleaginosum]KLT41639.1 hypothetical protein CC85DRAFT_286292 [Cutaneotrichosporon oleaginosum]TXT08124.1 hypothetical protein COLE_05048 [Cutaneotrichosporon oleaginosum]
MDTPDLPGIHSAATSTGGTPAPPSPRSSAPSPAPAESKGDARARRIAAAVVRSRTEYKPEHAYTERGWFLTTDHAGASKKDRQHVEYAATYRALVPSFLSPSPSPSSPSSSTPAPDPSVKEEAARALSDLLAVSKPPRELTTTAIRAAVLAGRIPEAAQLARDARPHWRANVGLAVEASAALAAAGDVAESTHPLLFTMAYALHHPVLVALGAQLRLLHAPEVDGLREAVDALAVSRAWAFTPLFGGERGVPRPVERGGELRAALGATPPEEIAGALGMEDAEERRLLVAALRRMEGALGRQMDEAEAIPGERVERGVREL